MFLWTICAEPQLIIWKLMLPCWKLKSICSAWGDLWLNLILVLFYRLLMMVSLDHGSDIDNDPHRFRVTITFDEQADKKTVVTLRQIHPTKAQRDGGIGFGAVELGYQTLDKCAEHIRSLQ